MTLFKMGGYRSFTRVEDENGKLVAYVGGESPSQMEKRALLFTAAPHFEHAARALILWGQGTIRDENDLQAIIETCLTGVSLADGK